MQMFICLFDENFSRALLAYLIGQTEPKIPLVFGCKDAALQVLMSVCLSMVDLKFCLIVRFPRGNQGNLRLSKVTQDYLEF